MIELSQEIRTELRQLYNDFTAACLNTRYDDKQQNSSGDTDNIKAQYTKLLNRLDEISKEVEKDSDLYYKVFSLKNSLKYEEAKVRLNRDEIDTSQELLESTLSSVSELKNHPKIIFLYLRVVNYLAYLFTKKSELEKARVLLEEVTNLDGIESASVYSTEDLFFNNEIDPKQSTIKLGKLIANNLQMLGWIYNKLGDQNLYALKLHEALQKLLDIEENDEVQWVTRCIRLAMLFLNRCKYSAARYHLAAAAYVLDKVEEKFLHHPELGKAQADLARCWIHYGLHLFGMSKKVILERMCNEDILTMAEDVSFPDEDDEPLDENLQFKNLNVTVDPVPVSVIKTTEQARALFGYIHIWLKRVRIFYTIRDYPILYVNTILNQSELYRYLAFYEPDLDSQYRVQKMRADSLEQLSTILKEVRPKCYVAISVELLRELAEVQIEMMSINLRKIYAQGQAETESEIRKKMQAVSDIHSKLEGVGDMLGHASFEDGDMLQESKVDLTKGQEEVKEELVETVENVDKLNEEPNKAEEGTEINVNQEVEENLHNDLEAKMED